MKLIKKKQADILNKAFFSTVITVALIELSQVGAGLVDSAITSRMLGTDAMAAVGIGYPIFSIAGLFSGILAMGMQSVCAKEIGRGNFKNFNTISSTTLTFGLLLTVLITIGAFSFADPLTRLLGARGNSADLFQPTKDYILGLSAGLPAIVMAAVLAPAIQLDNGASLVRKAALTDGATDIILDILAVKLGLGVFGMGLATSLSRYINLSILLLHFRKRDRMLHPSLRIVSLRTMLQILPKGSMMGVKRLANVIRPILINNYIIMLGGTAAMTALSVKNNVSSFADILGSGVAGAVPLLMGIAVGEKSTDDVLRVGKLVHRTTVFGTGAIAVAAALLASPIATFFVGTDPKLHSMAMFSVYMMAIELGLQTLLSSRVAYLNVISKFAESQLLQFSIKLLSIVPSVLVMGKLFGVYGVLSSFAVAYAVLLVIVYIVNAVRKKSAKLSPTDYLRLGDSFDIAPGDIIELSVEDMEDASLVSQQVQMFCKGHKTEGKKSYYAALALEESARLIFEKNGFSPWLSVDVRVIIQNGDIIMRIRDNGNSAYPFGGLGSDDENEDPLDNIGIRIVRKTAKDINYYHSLKINYTVITV